MRIMVLVVPDCPNAPVAVGRIAAALAGRPVSVELVEVSEEAEAARLGMTGSPTILLDGVDPFAGAGAVPSVSCRIYRGPDGTPAGAPSVQDLTAALSAAGLPGAAGDEGGEADVPDPVGRAGRGRRASAAGGLRAVHQAVLRHFAATGSAPEPAALEPAVARYGRTGGEVLAELDREDFLTLGADGKIRAAYPFSATQTPHRVRITGGAGVWSMCAIDALGIPAMLGQDVVITSEDPVTGEPVTVTAGPDRTTVWQPGGTVVYIGSRSGRGPAATVCCDALNFFTSAASARTWAGEHPDVTGNIVGQSRAEEIARQIFGNLLADD
jgi:Alkylmercury lyase